MPELVRRAIFAEYDYQVLSDRHSIGCKYIVLLEAFSALPIIGKPSDPNYSHRIEQFRKFI